MKTKITTFKLASMLIATILFLIPVSKLFSQDLEAEKTFELSKESKRGALLKVDHDESNGNYTLVYSTKLNKKIAKFETYVFDKDFNLLKSDKTELEFQKAKEQFTWWNFNGDEYTGEGVFVDPKDNLVVRKKEITYVYDWNRYRYSYTNKTLGKVKLRNDDGDRYYNMKYYEDNAGNAYVLCGIRDKDNKNRQYTDLHILKINKDMDVVKDLPIKFDFPQDDEFDQVITNDNGNFQSFMFIFSPRDAGRNSDPVKTNFTYVSINDKDDLIDRIPFTSLSPKWDIDDAILDVHSDDAYFYGPTPKGAFQLLKVSNHMISYLTETPYSEFTAKFIRPPSQKRGEPYSGKKYFITDHKLLPDGSILICGQNWDKGGMANTMNKMNGEGTKIRYTDCFTFYFDPTGKLGGQYSFYTTNSKWFANDYPNDQYFFNGKSSDNIYWLVVPGQPFGLKYYPPLISKINKTKGTIDEFKDINDFSGRKGHYILDYNFPYFDLGNGKLVFFGRSGNSIWFSRFRLD